MRVSSAPRGPSPGAAAEGGESKGSSAELQLALVALSTLSSPSLPHQGPGCTRGKEKTEEKQGGGDENEHKESTRSVLRQRRQRCLKESVHANWKCQGDLGTCIRALGNSNSSKPRLARSPFHAARVSTFPGYPTSCLSMQQLRRESRVWIPSPPGRTPGPPQTLGLSTRGQQQLRDRTQLFHTDLNHSWPDFIQLPFSKHPFLLR